MVMEKGNCGEMGESAMSEETEGGERKKRIRRSVYLNCSCFGGCDEAKWVTVERDVEEKRSLGKCGRGSR